MSKDELYSMLDISHTGPFLNCGNGHSGLEITPCVIFKRSTTGDVIERHRVRVFKGSTEIDITLEGKDIISPAALRKWADELEEFYEVKNEG